MQWWPSGVGQARSQVANAWAARRPIVVFHGVCGCSAWLAGQRLDSRGGAARSPIIGVAAPEEALPALQRLLGPPEAGMSPVLNGG